MGNRMYPADLIEQARQALAGWREIDPPFEVGPLQVEAFAAELAEWEATMRQIYYLEAQLVEQRNRRHAAARRLWEHLMGVRMAATAVFGDDSSELAMLGGKLRSQHKRRGRKRRAAQG